MRFAWQGFGIDVPDDYAPESIQGDFDRGYIRLSSPGMPSVQIRWARTKRPDLEQSVGVYLAQLQRAAGRKKLAFHSETRPQPDSVAYRWTADGQGRGILRLAGGRAFFLEVTGRVKEQLLPHLRRLIESFGISDGDLTDWAVLGLSLRIPSRARLARYSFQAGKTVLSFGKGSSRIEGARWGLAEQLLRRHELCDWAKSALALPKASTNMAAEGLRLTQRGLLATQEALVAVQSEHNQIVTVKSTWRNPKDRPRWEWLGS